MYTLLTYDMPSDSGIAPPSPMLHRWAIRTNKSVWIVLDQFVPMLPLKKWREKGAVVDVWQFAERDNEAILARCRATLQKELMTMRKTLESSINRVEARYKKLATDDEEGLKKASLFANRYARNARNFLEAAQESAAAFDILGDVHLLMNGLRECIKSTESIYFAMHQQYSEGKVNDESQSA